jgi:hypothetical protein
VTVGLTSSVAAPVTGQPISFTASVTSASPPGSGTPTGNIVFTVMGNNVLPGQPGYTETCAGGDTQPLSAGSATCNFPTGLISNPITFTVTATLHDGNFAAPSTASLVQVVNKAATTTAITGLPGSLIASQGFTFTVTIQTTAPGGNPPGGNLEWAVCVHNAPTCSGLPGGTFTLGKATKKDIANNERVLTYSVPGVLRPGFYTINANFSGDSDYTQSSSATGFILVNKAPTSMQIVLQRIPLKQGSTPVIRAAVIPSAEASTGLGAPQGTVTFTITGASGDTVNCEGGSNVITISTTSSNQGKGTCTIAPADVTVADSPYVVGVQYSGDSNYEPISGTQMVHIVNP